jgi:hypothetical protein
MVRPRDHHHAGLERLPQRIEHLGLKFGQLVEEEHPVMGKRDLPRPGVEAASDESRHGGRMMRRAKRRRLESSPFDNWPATDCTIEISRSSRGSAAAGSTAGAGASIDLPAPGGPLKSRLCPPAAAISRARFGAFLAL